MWIKVQRYDDPKSKMALSACLRREYRNIDFEGSGCPADSFINLQELSFVFKRRCFVWSTQLLDHLQEILDCADASWLVQMAQVHFRLTERFLRIHRSNCSSKPCCSRNTASPDIRHSPVENFRPQTSSTTESKTSLQKQAVFAYALAQLQRIHPWISRMLSKTICQQTYPRSPEVCAVET